jgi:hypothetical protein
MAVLGASPGLGVIAGFGAGLMGPFKLLTGARSQFRPGFIPELRIRLPLPSLALDTPYCASAELLQATRQRTANVIFM